MKQEDIVDITTEVTEKDLVEYASEHPRTEKTPKHLRPEAILVADKVFQRRNWDEDVGKHVEHARGFITTIRETGKSFEPITVVAVGDRWYLIDGHYRMIAYRSTQWRGLIPVRVLDCDVKGARLEALRLNVKHGLPMTSDERSEAAWQLVKDEEMTRADIVKETNVSRSTVATMRRTLAELREAKTDPAGLTWKQALSGLPREDLDADTYRVKVVAELQRKLLGALGPGIGRRADYLAEAIAIAYPGLPGALVPHWPEAVQAAYEDQRALEALDI